MSYDENEIFDHPLDEPIPELTDEQLQEVLKAIVDYLEGEE